MGNFCVFISYLLCVVCVFVSCFISYDVSMLMPLDWSLARVCHCLPLFERPVSLPSLKILPTLEHCSVLWNTVLSEYII